MNGTGRPQRNKQRGALMVALMAGIAILMILSAVAAQNWSDVVRRDAEAEMIFRAEDIVRALKRYQKDQGKLPNELKQLTEPGQRGQYFIRHLWKDPLVKGGKWQLLYAAPGGGIFDPSAPTTPGDQPPQLGQETPNPAGNPPAGIPEIKKNADGSTEVSGLPIAGVKTSSTEHPFRIYRDKEEYHEWAFSVFDQGAQAGTPPAQGAPGTQQPGGPSVSGGAQPGATIKNP